MAIYKITYSQGFKRANVYNWGCNFKCKGCSYKLKASYIAKAPFLSVKKVKEVLLRLDPEGVHFLGGEPTTNPNLPELARFCHNELKAYTKIGHSNGSIMPPKDIDAISVSIKAYTSAIHMDYTGVPNDDVLKNFTRIYEMGIEVGASSVFIPEYIDSDEIEKITKFIADVNLKIPYHITGYIPVPGTPWRGSMQEEVEHTVQIARKHLSNVTFSCLSLNEFLNLRKMDPRYRGVRVA